MGRDAGNTNLGRVLPEHLPDDLLAEPFAGEGASATNGPEHVTGGNACRRGPRIDRHFYPRWHWRSPNAAVLPDEIHDAPASVALLDVGERERRHFRASETAPENNCENGAINSACACRCDNQFPTRMPIGLTLFTRLMFCANSGASSPLSAASAASLRMADIRMMIDDDPSRRSSSDTRHALTVAFVKPGRGACWNQSMNSFSAMLYTRFVIGEETLSSTIVFNFCHCVIFSTAINSFILGPDVGH
jgi:hypothetical protein